MSSFDLLSTVEDGGCSAKLPAGMLSEVLKELGTAADPRLLVDVDTHDDAGVYKLNEDTALIFTTDFFPPICSDPVEFGEIAAANALSDVYAMGGSPLLALNLMMFPAGKIPLEVFGEILEGGDRKVREAGALTVGGHTIDDQSPKYGLAVVGTVHPDSLITNAGAKAGNVLILTKALGTGALVSGEKNGITSRADYQKALEQMKELNRIACELAVKYGVNGMTDITGFGLAGHALKMAEASGVSMRIQSSSLPLLGGAIEVFEKGSIPGAAFRNREFTGNRIHFTRKVGQEMKMMVHDAQTSGGLFMSVPADLADSMLSELEQKGLNPAPVGEVLEESPKRLYVE